MKQLVTSKTNYPKSNGKLIKQYPLAVVGTVAIDSLETPFGKKSEVFGGSASYFSYAASLFVPVALSAVVGKDFPSKYRNVLAERPIDLSNLIVADGKTFRWVGKYEEDLNSAKTIETHLNVLIGFNPQLNFEKIPEYLFLANVDPEIQAKVIDQLGKPRLKFVACDTMNFWIENKRESLLKVLKRVDCVILNDGEARLLTKESNLIKAAQKIRQMGPDRVVIKKGEHGALLFSGAQFSALPAFPLETVFDPTGAGDTFAGGMMGYIARSKDLSFDGMKKAIAYGSIVASFTVEKFGLERLRTLDITDIEERLRLFRKISHF